MAYDPINEYQNMLVRYNQGSATIGQMREAVLPLVPDHLAASKLPGSKLDLLGAQPIVD